MFRSEEWFIVSGWSFKRSLRKLGTQPTLKFTSGMKRTQLIDFNIIALFKLAENVFSVSLSLLYA